MRVEGEEDRPKESKNGKIQKYYLSWIFKTKRQLFLQKKCLCYEEAGVVLLVFIYLGVIFIGIYITFCGNFQEIHQECFYSFLYRSWGTLDKYWQGKHC